MTLESILNSHNLIDRTSFGDSHPSDSGRRFLQSWRGHGSTTPNDSERFKSRERWAHKFTRIDKWDKNPLLQQDKRCWNHGNWRRDGRWSNPRPSQKSRMLRFTKEVFSYFYDSRRNRKNYSRTQLLHQDFLIFLGTQSELISENPRVRVLSLS